MTQLVHVSFVVLKYFSLLRVYAVLGNYVIDLISFSSILQEVAMCRACEVGSLELSNSGKRNFVPPF